MSRKYVLLTGQQINNIKGNMKSQYNEFDEKIIKILDKKPKTLEKMGYKEDSAEGVIQYINDNKDDILFYEDGRIAIRHKYINEELLLAIMNKKEQLKEKEELRSKGIDERLVE